MKYGESTPPFPLHPYSSETPKKDVEDRIPSKRSSLRAEMTIFPLRKTRDGGEVGGGGTLL